MYQRTFFVRYILDLPVELSEGLFLVSIFLYAFFTFSPYVVAILSSNTCYTTLLFLVRVIWESWVICRSYYPNFSNFFYIEVEVSSLRKMYILRNIHLLLCIKAYVTSVFHVVRKGQKLYCRMKGLFQQSNLFNYVLIPFCMLKFFKNSVLYAYW